MFYTTYLPICKLHIIFFYIFLYQTRLIEHWVIIYFSNRSNSIFQHNKNRLHTHKKDRFSPSAFSPNNKTRHSRIFTHVHRKTRPFRNFYIIHGRGRESRAPSAKSAIWEKKFFFFQKYTVERRMWRTFWDRKRAETRPFPTSVGTLLAR